MFEVAEQRCDQCLFSPDRIVSSRRMAQVLQECRAENTHFICHKFTIDGGRNVCCRGFYDQPQLHSQFMRIAGRLGQVRFVPLPEGEPHAS